jgi:hypothetical protein
MSESPFGILAICTLCLTLSLLVACTPAPSPDPLPTGTAPLQATEPAAVAFSLPAPLYYLREGQVWRLAQDGESQQQITHEAAPVDSFDVSPIDSALVYVTGNSLIHADADGENRRVLMAGPELPPVADELARLNDRAYIAGQIRTPVWSPDGERIAYVQNGLNAMVVSNGKVRVIHPNDFFPEEGEVSDRRVIDSAISWAPDGQHLLVMVYTYPLDSIYYRDVALKTLFGYLSMKGECYQCTFAWSGDSQHFFLGNPFEGGQGALTRCDIADGRCTLIALDIPARKAYFYAYPHSLNPDGALVFMASSPSPEEPPEMFKMFRVQSDGYGTVQLREDEWSIQTALWARDSRGVLIVTGSAGGDVPPDTLVWLPVDGGPAIPLPVTGARVLRWGVSGRG